MNLDRSTEKATIKASSNRLYPATIKRVELSNIRLKLTDSTWKKSKRLTRDEKKRSRDIPENVRNMFLTKPLLNLKKDLKETMVKDRSTKVCKTDSPCMTLKTKLIIIVRSLILKATSAPKALFPRHIICS